MYNPILGAIDGTWLETNIISLIVLVGSIVAGAITIGYYRRTVHELEDEVEGMKGEIKRMGTRLTNHISDTDKHVNQLYMQTFRKDVDKLEATMNVRVDRLEGTLNGRMDKMEITMKGDTMKIMDKLELIARKQ